MKKIKCVPHKLLTGEEENLILIFDGDTPSIKLNNLLVQFFDDKLLDEDDLEFNKNHLLEVLNFAVDKEVITVSCKGGMSRSTAISIFLHVYFNGKTNVEGLFGRYVTPNNHILSIGNDMLPGVSEIGESFVQEYLDVLLTQ